MGKSILASWVLFFLLLFLVEGCSRPDRTAPRTTLPSIDAPKSDPPKSRSEEEEEVRASGSRYTDPLEDLWVKLDNDVRMQVAPTSSIGCLPFVSYDLKHEAGWVSQLGVRISDELARRLRRGRVLGTDFRELKNPAGRILKITVFETGKRRSQRWARATF